MPGRARARVTDVAAAAGVSPTTVSHALSGARTVNPATRERILSIAKELGYVPDRVASGLRRRRTGVVALIGDDLAATPFAGRIIEFAGRTAQFQILDDATGEWGHLMVDQGD
jgi:LacI family transcriptional regulator